MFDNDVNASIFVFALLSEGKSFDEIIDNAKNYYRAQIKEWGRVTIELIERKFKEIGKIEETFYIQVKPLFKQTMFGIPLTLDLRVDYDDCRITTTFCQYTSAILAGFLDNMYTDDDNYLIQDYEIHSNDLIEQFEDHWRVFTCLLNDFVDYCIRSGIALTWIKSLFFTNEYKQFIQS